MLNISTVYLLLFTSVGNDIVSPIIEKKVNEQGIVNFKLKEFILTTDSIKFIANIDEVSNIEIDGDLDLFAKSIDLNYLIDIKDLSKLEKFTKQKLNGNFKTNGSIKGDRDLIEIIGNSDLFESDTKYLAHLKAFKPSKIEFLVIKAKIEKLLYTLNQPIYSNGNIDIVGTISNPNIDNLAGEILTKIYDGKINNLIVNKSFDLKLKDKVIFNGNIQTDLKQNLAISKIDFLTSLLNLSIKKAIFNLDDNSINSDYLVSIGKLNNLYDFTNMKLKGGLIVNGMVKKNKDLIVEGKSNLLAGSLEFKLLNDDFTSKISNIEVKALTDMLYYPSFFDSKANINLTYNLKNSNGIIDANFINGHFLPTKFSNLINMLAQFNITKEIYNTVELKSKIDKKIIQSTIFMKSNHTEINIPSSRLDLDKKLIDAKVNLEIKGLDLNAKISGNIDSPNIDFDTTKLLKSGVEAKATNKIKNLIENKLDEKFGDGTTKELLNSLKSFF